MQPCVEPCATEDERKLSHNARYMFELATEFQDHEKAAYYNTKGLIRRPLA